MPPKKKLPAFNVIGEVRKKLKHTTYDWTPKIWLDTGSRELNACLGDSERGIPFGKMIEISGEPSNGKSVLALDLLACAQDMGALGIWVDFENSWSPDWSASRGVRVDEVNVVEAMVGTFGSEKERRLATAEEMLEEAENTMMLLHKRFPKKPQLIVLDSVAAMLVEDEAEAGLTEQNLRTRNALPLMLSQMLRRWIGLTQVYNCIAIFVNQLRNKPMAFGDPNYTPGGKALPFYCHSRVRLKRPGKSRLLKSGELIGIKGTLRNDKNKIGGREGAQCGFKFYWDGRSKFFAVDEGEDNE